jgi:DNA-binding NtrC family response regulator
MLRYTGERASVATGHRAVRLPSLEDRLDELPAWATHMFLRRHAESGGGVARRITEAAMELLLHTPWPGNLRQLDNIVRRAYAIMISSSATTPARPAWSPPPADTTPAAPASRTAGPSTAR